MNRLNHPGILFGIAAWLCAAAPAVSQQKTTAPAPGRETSASASAPKPQAGSGSTRPTGDQPPPAPREFRAAWVASVQNAQWPSKPGLPVALQKQEMLHILDRCAALHLNAVILQVRPCADALYPSNLEPWSEYLTGTQGKPPEPMWDPLQTWIEEAHKRGLELHAWFNPYRVKHVSSKSPQMAENSIARTHPEVVREYGKYLWMDPGEPVAARQTLDVIADLVRRYDVDGVHTDDYYYPYKVNDKDGKEVDFPDDASYRRYRDAGGTLERADWRRDNVNRLVQEIYKTTHEIKPWVKVGYAPFGIWKSGVPKGIVGLSQYDALYADARLWLNKGWLDYMAPQLYWKIGGPQDFKALLTWWSSENTQGRHLWPGLSVGRHPVEEVITQIELTRQAEGTSAGSILWSVNNVLGRPELYDALEKGPFADAALVPATPWLDANPPSPPAVQARKKKGGDVAVALSAGSGEPPALYGVWARRGREWTFSTVPKATAHVVLEPSDSGVPVSKIVATAVDRTGNESTRVTIAVKDSAP
jgi:uncharacterized lipoprotein YddW (UPF0748 family)